MAATIHKFKYRNSGHIGVCGQAGLCTDNDQDVTCSDCLALTKLEATWTS